MQGSLIINGDQFNPVNIFSTEGGRGISVFNAKENSYIKHTLFNGLKPNTESSINITGAVSFYNSPVEISNAKFINSYSEDALNLVRSPFSLDKVTFTNNNSDAIDIDFSNGKIENSIFQKTGNDAIDVSGSSVILNKIKIKSAGDKAISIGENSKVKANNIDVLEVFIGIASKDFSTALIEKLNIKDSKICLAAYQKKREYGPGFIEVKKSTDGCSSNYVLEDGSSIIVGGYNLLPGTENAYKDLYGE